MLLQYIMVCRFPACPKKPKRLWVLRLPGFDSFFSHGCSDKMRNPTISSDLFLSLINPNDDTLRHEKCRANIGRCYPILRSCVFNLPQRPCLSRSLRHQPACRQVRKPFVTIHPEDVHSAASSSGFYGSAVSEACTCPPRQLAKRDAKAWRSPWSGRKLFGSPAASRIRLRAF